MRQVGALIIVRDVDKLLLLRCFGSLCSKELREISVWSGCDANACEDLVSQP